MSSSSNPLLPPLSTRKSSSKPFFLYAPVEPRLFLPHPSLSVASRVTLESAGVGLLVSAVKNALEKFVACSTTLIWADNEVDMIGELWGSSREQEEQSLSLVSLNPYFIA